MKKNPRNEDLERAGIDFRNMDPNLNFGRPNLSKLFRKMKEYASKNGIKKVGVLSCGPKSMVDEAAFLSKSDVGDVKFDFHSEFFDF